MNLVVVVVVADWSSKEACLMSCDEFVFFWYQNLVAGQRRLVFGVLAVETAVGRGHCRASMPVVQ